MNYKKVIVDYAQLLEQKGYVNALEGNISIYDKENDKLYITPSGKRKLTLTEDMVAVLNFEDEQQVEGVCKASSEYRLHKAAYQARKDCSAVVHCHSTFLTAYALQCRNIKIDSCTAFLFAKGEIKCVPFGMPGTTHIADGLDEAIADRDIALLGNHGVVSVGKDLESAFAILETMEETVKTHTISKLTGTPQPIPGFEAMIK